MKLDLFDYQLPADLIAQKPVSPRDHSRLFVYKREADKVTHKHFFDLPDILIPGDVLVFNNTKVFPARLIGKKVSGGKMEVFLLKELDGGLWQVLLGGKRRKEGVDIIFNKKLSGRVVKQGDDGTWIFEFNLTGDAFWLQIDKIGHVPIPPYIKRESNMREYQTVFAKEKGSVAAPTAGLHFTRKLLNSLKKNGIQIEYVTLHVGLGTFAPVKTEEIESHKMHAEWACLDRKTSERLNRAKIEKRRIIGVGTTSVRTLESFCDNNGRLVPQSKWVDSFIYPGVKFKFIDAMITNFHLPKSTLLMLLAAFLAQNKKQQDGIEIFQRLYRQAISEKYRFYSYGDGMLLL